MIRRNASRTGLRPFDPSGYEILDQDLLARGELVIWSTGRLVPQIGELYTIESGGAVHEVEVEAVTPCKGHGWAARCRLFGLVKG